jgi:hypothetical protein
MRSTNRFAVFFIAVTLGVTSCGGSPSESSGGPLTATELGTRLTTSFDGDGVAAGAALVLALDRGYSFPQVVAAVAAGTLRSHGAITSGEGFAAPSGADTGVIVDKGGMEADASAVILTAGGSALGGGVTVSELKGHLDSFTGFARTEIDRRAAQDAVQAETEELFLAAPAAVAHLANAGYSVAQIVESFVFATVRCDYDFTSLADLSGYKLHVLSCEILGEQPALRPPDVLAADTQDTATTTSSQPAATGDQFVGEATESPDLAEYFTVVSSRIAITIEDGTANIHLELSVTYGARFFNEAPVCTVTAQSAYRGSLPISNGGFSGSIRVQSGEITEAIGPECGVGENWDTTVQDDYAVELVEDPELPIVGTIDAAGVSGTLADGLFSFTARP